jgi:hypothetical protein
MYWKSHFVPSCSPNHSAPPRTPAIRTCSKQSTTPRTPNLANASLIPNRRKATTDRSSSQPNEANEIESKARVVFYRRRVHRQRHTELSGGRERGGGWGLTMVAPTRVRSKPSPSRSCRRGERETDAESGGLEGKGRYAIGVVSCWAGLVGGGGGEEKVPEGDDEASRSARSTRPGPGSSAPFPARLGSSSCMGCRSNSLRPCGLVDMCTSGPDAIRISVWDVWPLANGALQMCSPPLRSLSFAAVQHLLVFLGSGSSHRRPVEKCTSCSRICYKRYY